MTARPSRDVVSVVVFLMAALVTVAAQQHVRLTDAQIKAQVEHRLIDHDIRGVVVAVTQRTVTLSGTVESLWVKAEAVKQAQKADDVNEVVSTLTIMRGESDRAVGVAVAEKLRRYVFFSIFDDVNVAVTDGVVTLTGYVTMPYKAHAMTERASRVTGVQRVDDRIEVLPVSLFDDEIRHRVAVRIYNDPLFWHYAIQANPPIHIIVQHGRVTLTGVVGSEVERRKAELIAREVGSVLEVDNQLRLEG